MDERVTKLIEELAARNPELVEKYGNPLDKEDPRNWTPTERAEKGLSETEQLRLLGLDVESQAKGFAALVQRMFDLEFQLDKAQRLLAELSAREFTALVKEGKIEEAMALMKKVMGSGEDPSFSSEVAPSNDGQIPMVQTVNGPIRLDQVPGYRDDPEWRPSPDWLDANCTCEVHTKKREEAKGQNPFGDFGTGMYL